MKPETTPRWFDKRPDDACDSCEGGNAGVYRCPACAIYRLERERDEAADASARWWTAASPYATPDALYEAIRSFSKGQLDTKRLDWLLDDYRRIDLYHIIGTMSRDPAECRAAIDAAMLAAASAAPEEK